MSAAAPLYKILVDGKSCHGGDLTWSLPTDDGHGGWKPGAWHAVKLPLRVCVRGLHLTHNPAHWLVLGGMVYAAEGDGASVVGAADDKVVFERARLLRPAPEAIPAWWRGIESFVRDEIDAVQWFRPVEAPDPNWVLHPGQTRETAQAAAWDNIRDDARDDTWEAAQAAAWAAGALAAREADREAAWETAWRAAWEASQAASRSVTRVVARERNQGTIWAATWGATWGASRDVVRDVAWDAALCCVLRTVCADLPIDQRHRDQVEGRWAAWRRGFPVLFNSDGVLHVWDTRPKESGA